MCLLDLEVGKILVILKGEVIWWWVEESERRGSEDREWR